MSIVVTQAKGCVFFWVMKHLTQPLEDRWREGEKEVQVFKGGEGTDGPTVKPEQQRYWTLTMVLMNGMSSYVFVCEPDE